ncbi:MAG: Flp pilus assembly protein CpaB [Planctomycetota bacterium]
MRNKSMFLLVALGCGTIAAIGVSQWMAAQAGNQPVADTVEIFVTSKTIDIGEQISPDSIRLEQWPADRVPQGASGKLEDLEGKYARQRFYEGEPVMPVKLMDSANGSSQTIPVGYSVVSMRADDASSVASLLRPGDRVDVAAYFVKSELIPETTAKTVLTGVRVFAVDGRTDRDTSESTATRAKSISLLIHKNDTPAWTYASELGKIRLTLGNPTDTPDSDTGEGNGAAQEFLQWLSDHQIAQAQDEADLEGPEPAVQPVSAPAPPPKKKGFKMVKMSGGVLTEYWIEEGKTIPLILSESGAPTDAGVALEESTNGLGTGAAVPSAPSDYSYLNGSQSPFYQPSEAEQPAGLPSPSEPNPY